MSKRILVVEDQEDLRTGSLLFSLCSTVRSLLAHRRLGVEDFGAHLDAARLVDELRRQPGAKRIGAELEDVVGYPDIIATQHFVPDGEQGFLRWRGGTAGFRRKLWRELREGTAPVDARAGVMKDAPPTKEAVETAEASGEGRPAGTIEERDAT